MSKVVKFSVPKEVEGTAVEEDYLSAAQQVLKEQTVLRLFEQGKISAGYAAQVLDLDCYEFLDLLNRQGIPSLNLSDEEFKHELQAVAKVSKKISIKKKRQR